MGRRKWASWQLETSCRGTLRDECHQQGWLEALTQEVPCTKVHESDLGHTHKIVVRPRLWAHSCWKLLFFCSYLALESYYTGLENQARPVWVGWAHPLELDVATRLRFLFVFLVGTAVFSTIQKAQAAGLPVGQIVQYHCTVWLLLFLSPSNLCQLLHRPRSGISQTKPWFLSSSLLKMKHGQMKPVNLCTFPIPVPSLRGVT